jgi:hypothetical protein
MASESSDDQGQGDEATDGEEVGEPRSKKSWKVMCFFT